MTDKDRQELYELLKQSQSLASDIVNFVQDHVAYGAPGATEGQVAVIKGALAIAYTTLSKATGTSMHDVIDLVMTIYKNTEVERE